MALGKALAPFSNVAHSAVMAMQSKAGEHYVMAETDEGSISPLFPFNS